IVPNPVPDELRSLTMSEEMMISMAFPVCKVIRLAGGAHGYKGHVLSVGQDIGGFVGNLPWLPNSDEMPVIIIQPPDGGSWAGRQFKVSLERVERALNYLMLHSPPYMDIRSRIDMDRVRLHLQDEPREDGIEPMPDPLEHEDEGDNVRDPEDASGLAARPQRGPAESFIPMPGDGRQSEAEILRQQLEHMTNYTDNGQSGAATMQYPGREAPLREDTPWLWSMCFPTLFPNGVGDPSQAHQRTLTDVDIVTHLMKFVDRPEGEAPYYRFASHRTFRYWALDMRLRKTARLQCRIFLRNNPALTSLDPSEVNDDTIRQLMSVATRYVANVPGTDGYWKKWEGKLEDTIDQLPSLSTFTTYSAADHHMADLYRLIPRAGPEPEAGVGAGNVRPIQERNRLLIANPHIADWWIWERMQVFKKYFLGKDMANTSWHWDRAEWQSRSTLHVHGCSSWECEGEERVTELARTYLRGHIGRVRASRDGEDPPGDGGVSDEEMSRVKDGISSFLCGIGFTALNLEPPPTPADPQVPTSEEARARGREELARDMRTFDWDDVGECERRYKNLVNACMRHTRHGGYCLVNGRCRFGFPKPRQESLGLEAHPLTTPPTDNVDDWQLIATPQNALPRREGEEGEGVFDPCVNRHVVAQLLGWGSNVDFSPIVDMGMAGRYMVKYTTKGESRSSDVQRTLATLVRHAATLDADDDDRLTLPSIMRKVLNMATTRRDMGVQEVQHLNLQTCNVLHNVEYVRAYTEQTSVEVESAGADGGLRPVRDLLLAYSRRMDQDAWVPIHGGRPQQDAVLEEMNYCTFAATYKLTREKKITTHDRKNRVVSFLPIFSHSPTSPKYADYCRSQLVKYRPWRGPLHNGWDGEEGEEAT
ncbi:unnamed protein product, partial [Ectocarpus sp. 8 AP-2014]